MELSPVGSVEKRSALDMLPAQAIGTVVTETRINKWLNLLDLQELWVAMTVSSGAVIVKWNQQVKL